MSRINLQDNRCEDLYIASGFKLGMTEIIPANDYQVTKDHTPILRLTPAGAINVRLPDSNPETKGTVHIIANVGAGGTITFVTSGGAAFTPALSVAGNANIMLVCTGLAGANGWRVCAT